MIERIVHFLVELLEKHGERVLLWNGIAPERIERYDPSFQQDGEEIAVRRDLKIG